MSENRRQWVFLDDEMSDWVDRRAENKRVSKPKFIYECLKGQMDLEKTENILAIELEPELIRKIEVMAQDQVRSLEGQVVWILQQYFEGKTVIRRRETD